VLSFTWNSWKFSKNFSFSSCQEYMHLGGSHEYQFVVAPFREIISDLVRAASSPLVEVMAAS
jgi:hypothetical protein